MTIAGTYLDEQDIESMWPSELVVKIWDDDRDGELNGAEEARANRCVARAEARVEAFLFPAYGDTKMSALRTLGQNCDDELKRLCLEALEIEMGRRHPDFIRLPWEMKIREFNKDMERLRTRITQLATASTPEPALNSGGIVLSGRAEPEEEVRRGTFARGFGLF